MPLRTEAVDALRFEAGRAGVVVAGGVVAGTAGGDGVVRGPAYAEFADEGWALLSVRG